MIDESLLMETILENTKNVIKILIATSPILLIGFILFTVREDEEEEQAKREHKKKCVKSW